MTLAEPGLYQPETDHPQDGRNPGAAEDFDALLEKEIYQLMMGCYESEYPSILQGVRHAQMPRGGTAQPISSLRTGDAIQKLLAHYGFHPSEAIAFGDGNNDTEMLQSVGAGVAMADGSEQLKTVAADVCGHVAQDGIYHDCRAHGLISGKALEQDAARPEQLVYSNQLIPCFSCFLCVKWS